MPSTFFDEQSGASAIKAEIVNKYFWAWAKVMINRNKVERLAYIDLFAGPGRYENGASSTPLLVLETALADQELARRLLTVFNDQNPEHIRSLQTAIAAIPGIDGLRNMPKFHNLEVTETITRWFEASELPPSLVFFDPWGYKGLSLGLIDAALSGWGSDLVFFFNYNRINMGIRNDVVEDHMEALFGRARAGALRQAVGGMGPSQRELHVVNAVGEALLERRAKYLIPFRFRSADGARTSHYLFFASKHELGYKIMKDIMYAASAKSDDGVATFEYTPVEDRQLGLLFAYSRPIDDLRRRLMNKFRGRTLTVDSLIQGDHVGTPYVEKNYKDILVEMEVSGEVVCDPPVSSRPRRSGKPTMAGHVRVSF